MNQTNSEEITPIPADANRTKFVAEGLALNAVEFQQQAKSLQNSMEIIHKRAVELLNENVSLNRALIDERAMLKWVEDNYRKACSERDDNKSTIDKQRTDITGMQFRIDKSAKELTQLRRYVIAMWLWCAFVVVYFLFLLYIKG